MAERRKRLAGRVGGVEKVWESGGVPFDSRVDACLGLSGLGFCGGAGGGGGDRGRGGGGAGGEGRGGGGGNGGGGGPVSGLCV